MKQSDQHIDITERLDRLTQELAQLHPGRDMSADRIYFPVDHPLRDKLSDALKRVALDEMNRRTAAANTLCVVSVGHWPNVTSDTDGTGRSALWALMGEAYDKLAPDISSILTLSAWKKFSRKDESEEWNRTWLGYADKLEVANREVRQNWDRIRKAELQQRREAIELEKQRKFISELMQRIPPYFRHPVDREQLGNPYAFDEAASFDPFEENRGIVCTGGFQKGKTRAMYRLIIQCALRHGTEWIWEAIDAKDLADKVKTSGRSPKELVELCDKLKWNNFLLVDDFDKPKWTDGFLATLWGIIKHKTENETQFAITTNLTSQGFLEKIQRENPDGMVTAMAIFKRFSDTYCCTVDFNDYTPPSVDTKKPSETHTP